MADFRAFLLLTILLTAAIPAAAQEDRSRAVLLKGGVNIERSEDGIEGESPAFGADLWLPLGDRWAFDVEFWLPAYFTARDEIRHRDIIFSVGVFRHFGDGRTRPFLAFGLGTATVQEQRPAPIGDTRNTDGYGYVGIGADIRISRRVSIVPEVRATLAPAAFLLRPAIGMAFRF